MQPKHIVNYNAILALINIRQQFEIELMDRIYIGLGDLQNMIMCQEQHLKVGIMKYNTITMIHFQVRLQKNQLGTIHGARV